MSRDSNAGTLTVTGLPTWVPSPGQWAAVGLNTLASQKGADAASSTGLFNNILDAWCGCVHAPLVGGVYGSLIIGPGGGHDSWDGSDVYAYDIETRQVSRFKDTYNPTTNNDYPTGAYPDGSPLPPHNYCGYAVMPSMGPKGSLFVPWTYTNNTAGPNGKPIAHDCFFLNLDTKVWTRGPNTSPSRYHASAIAPDGSVWFRAGAGSQPLKRISADGTTLTTYSSSTFNSDTYNGAAIDPTRGLFFHWEGNLKKLGRTTLSSPNTSPTQWTFGSGPNGAASMGYVAVLDRIIGYGGGKTVYTLDPANPAAGWTAQGSGSTLTPPGLTAQDSVYSKVRWVESVKCLIGIINTSTVAWAYRPVGT